MRLRLRLRLRLRCRLTAMVLGLTTMVAAPASTHASPAGRRVVVLPWVVDGELEAGRREQIDAALRQGLQRGELQIVQAPPVASSCDEPGCAARIAREANADHAVLPTIAIQRRDYALRLDVVDARRATAVAQSAERCEVCGMAEVVDLVESQAAAIGGRLEALRLEPPVLVFESTPPKALVRVDGEVAGEAPFEREVEPGEHTAEASLDGHVTQRRQIEAVAGVRSTITFDLPPVPRSVRYRKLRLFGWTALGVGAAALVAGPVLIGIDGRENRTMCSGDDVDAQGDCRLLYATSEAGIAVTVIGGALLATGIGIAIGTRDRRTGATADVFAHPRGIVVRARF